VVSSPSGAEIILNYWSGPVYSQGSYKWKKVLGEMREIERERERERERIMKTVTDDAVLEGGGALAKERG
jgi:hypothetical protein